jgi:hypothetical protein
MSGCDDSINVANEYAAVTLRKTSGENGPVLEIRSTMLDHSITLDEDDLLSLVKQEKTFFSRLLSSPYGPINPDEAFKEEM